MKKEIKYAAVFYYEMDSMNEGKGRVYIRYPDLERAGIPAVAVSDSRERESVARDLLQSAIEFAIVIDKELPNPSPIESINIKRDIDAVAQPFKIEIVNILL
ncbi:hypothetical protein [Sporosarcina ureilytica]|uniref:HicB-like antitoxin of toxin-antitoxin system domain-containing protein n=1 Tax=Sporosarcina ureilytica TaxID=298596 RepID=A0A1D8JFJ9_9BACL|nr:hypothetical protein [Sporosarcina ureilytica]AOV07458.1 hypothetical protein BI350_07840 [Sporosarcina ureilytica]